MAKPAHSNIAKIVHESETQRQHIRVELPAVVKLAGKAYKVKDISTGGFSLKTDKEFILPQGVQEVKILFSFENFAFHLSVKIAPIYFNKTLQVAGFRFNEMNARQVSVLNHVVKSCLAGLIIGEGEIINIIARDNFTPPREEKAGNDNRVRSFFSRVLPVAAVAVAGLVGLFLIFGNIYENTSVVKSYMSVVGGDVFTVRAQTDGVYYSLLPLAMQQVTKGQNLAFLKTAPPPGSPVGTLPQDVMIQSPCDCLIINRFSQEGEFHALGEPLFELLPKDGRTWISASLSPEQVHRLQLLDDAHIKIAGESTFIQGNVSEFLPPLTDDNMARVRVKTNSPIPAEFIGRLAYVEFVIR